MRVLVAYGNGKRFAKPKSQNRPRNLRDFMDLAPTQPSRVSHTQGGRPHSGTVPGGSGTEGAQHTTELGFSGIGYVSVSQYGRCVLVVLV